MSTDHVLRTLHVHIGIPKTASTWLQNKVFPLLTHLHFVDRPKSRLFDASGGSAGRPLMPDILQRSSEIWPGFGDAIFENLLGNRDAWLANGRDLLISEEGIGRQASRPALLGAHLQKMRQKASEWGFDRFNIVCIIRRQDHWLASHHAQMSDRNPKAGQADFERLVREVSTPELARYGFGMLLDYNAIHEHLTDLLGAECLTLLPYEWLKQSPSMFLQTLLEGLGTPSAEISEVIRLTPGTTANARSSDGIWHLRPQPVRKIAGVSLPRWCAAKPDQTIEITDDIAGHVRNAYSSSNRKLALKTGLSLEAYGYFDFSPNTG